MHKKKIKIKKHEMSMIDIIIFFKSTDMSIIVRNLSTFGRESGKDPTTAEEVMVICQFR